MELLKIPIPVSPVKPPNLTVPAGYVLLGVAFRGRCFVKAVKGGWRRVILSTYCAASGSVLQLFPEDKEIGADAACSRKFSLPTVVKSLAV